MTIDLSHLVRKAEAGSPPRIALPSDAGLVSGVAFRFLIDRSFEKTCLDQLSKHHRFKAARFETPVTRGQPKGRPGERLI